MKCPKDNPLLILYFYLFLFTLSSSILLFLSLSLLPLYRSISRRETGLRWQITLVCSPPHNSICAHLVVLKGGPLLLLCTCTSTVRFFKIFTQFALPINQSCPCCPSGRQFHKVEFKVVALVTVTENVTVDVFVVVVVTTVIVVITVVVVYCCCCLLLL